MEVSNYLPHASDPVAYTSTSSDGQIRDAGTAHLLTPAATIFSPDVLTLTRSILPAPNDVDVITFDQLFADEKFDSSLPGMF